MRFCEASALHDLSPFPAFNPCWMLQVVKAEGAGLPHVNVPTTMEVLAGRTRGPSAAQQYPIPREMVDLMNFSVMPSDHRNYALTWYSLSAATAFLALSAAKTR